MQSLADGSKQDHCSDADGDAQPGEEAAHPVGEEAGSGQFYKVRKQHGCYFPASAATGSSCAARRAGHTLNRMPVPIAMPQAASTAHQGGETGRLGYILPMSMLPA